MAHDGCKALRIEVRDGVAWVTIDHPPINLFDLTLMPTSTARRSELRADDAVRVVVFRAAIPTSSSPTPTSR